MDSPERIYLLKDIVVDEKIILKWILQSIFGPRHALVNMLMNHLANFFRLADRLSACEERLCYFG
jgi:hypothetical protein